MSSLTVIKKNASNATADLSMNYKWLEKNDVDKLYYRWLAKINTCLFDYSKDNKVDCFIENFCFNLDY